MPRTSERMMICSDCAFAVYNRALQAAVSLCHVMWRFLSVAAPVRICIPKGTCHSERFSIESFNSLCLTRSMFYASGIVFAVSGEENSGPGCRVFLHRSLELPERTLTEGRLRIMPTPRPSDHAEYELNYLYKPVAI